MANGSLEAIDRKAALVPATLGVIAGVFVGSTAAFSGPETVVLIAAVGTGIVSALSALQVLWARVLTIGPNATTTADATHLDPADFNRAVAGSLALSIDKMTEAAKWKAARLNRAIGWAGATILVLAVARIVGGIT